MRSYGSKQLQNCVEKLGFIFNSISSSHHAKYDPPPTHNLSLGGYTFFQFQLGRKTYDTNAANRYITQLKRFGFTKQEIEKHLK